MTADQLILRRARAQDDYDVVFGGKVVGRIFRPRAGVPADRPWMWTITGAIVAPKLPNHGFETSREEAMTAFATTWRAWLRSCS